MKYYAFRLHRGQDLKQEIVKFIDENKINGGTILTCVGSLVSANIRLADENISKKYEEKFEIVSLVGTLSKEGCHLHISIADSSGKVIGGHLLDGCRIYTTAEIVIGKLSNLKFSREYDEETGFKELEVKGLF